MVKIQEVINELVKADDTAVLAMREGIINYSAYARKIKPLIDEALLLDVSYKSIVVGLTRLAKTLNSSQHIRVKLDQISVHPNLGELSYERNSQNMKLLSNIHEKLIEKQSQFFTITESIGEITFVANNSIISSIKSIFSGVDPIYTNTGLTGITVKFSKEYMEVPNVIYDITRQLAIKDINIIEIVSTTTELTFIIEKQNTELAVGQLSKLV